MKSAFTHWANLEAARDDSAMSLNYEKFAGKRGEVPVTQRKTTLAMEWGKVGLKRRSFSRTSERCIALAFCTRAYSLAVRPTQLVCRYWLIAEQQLFTRTTGE